MLRIKNRKKGFTLVEILIYVAVFTVSSIFLVGILTIIIRTQVRQSTLNEVNSQLSFAVHTIQQAIQSASSIENNTGVASNTLTLRTQLSTEDKIKIYTDPSDKILYIETIPDGSMNGSRVAITNARVQVSNFSVTRHENDGGIAVMQIDLMIDSTGTNPQSVISRVWRGAVSRVSAATFDSNILPTGGSLTLGASGSPTWDRLYLGDGSAGTPSFTFGSDSGLGFFRSGNGLGISVGGTERASIDATGILSVSGEISVGGVTGTGNAICVKSDTTFGTCSTAPNASGVCTCN